MIIIKNENFLFSYDYDGEYDVVRGSRTIIILSYSIEGNMISSYTLLKGKMAAECYERRRDPACEGFLLSVSFFLTIQC